MQKIRNRSNFFQKIFHIRYIAKNFENVQVLSGILPKILKTVPLFWKNLPHRVYFQNFWKRSHFSELFSKNLSMASSGRPDIGISTILYAPIRQIRQIRQNYPLPGLYPKSPSTVPFHFYFFPKILSLHHCISVFTTKNVAPLFNFFPKIFIRPLPGLYPKSATIALLLSEKIWKKHHPCTSDYQDCPLFL